MIVVFSFNKPERKFNIIWQEFTFDNWRHPFAPGPLTDAMVVVAAGRGHLRRSLATILGTLIALALVRYRFRGGALDRPAARAPAHHAGDRDGRLAGHAVLRPSAWQRGFGTIVIAHILFCTSFVALTVKARIRGFDWTLEDAAMDLGATAVAHVPQGHAAR